MQDTNHKRLSRHIRIYTIRDSIAVNAMLLAAMSYYRKIYFFGSHSHNEIKEKFKIE